MTIDRPTLNITEMPMPPITSAVHTLFAATLRRRRLRAAPVRHGLAREAARFSPQLGAQSAGADRVGCRRGAGRADTAGAGVVAAVAEQRRGAGRQRVGDRRLGAGDGVLRPAA